MSVETLITDMTSLGVDPIWGRSNNTGSNIQCPINFAALEYLRRDQFGTYRTSFPDYVDTFTTWFWFYLGSGTVGALNKRVHYRNVQSAIKSGTTGLWTILKTHNRQKGQLWTGNSSFGDLGDQRDEADGSSALIRSPNEGYEVWPDPDFYHSTTRAQIVDTVAMAAFCEVRIINDDGTPYTGSDYVIVAKMGWDPYARNRAVPTAAGGNGPYGKDTANYPKFMMDGGNSCWKRITGAMGWTPVGCVNITGRGFDKAPPPYGDYTSPTWPIGYLEPYNLSPASLRANKPAFLV